MCLHPETNTIIKERIAIGEVIQNFIPLQKKGNCWWAICPFHTEKTASFCVHDQGFFKCFGCDQKGDAIQFIISYQKLSFIEAMKWLADFYHIPWKEKNASPTSLIKRKKNATRQSLLNEATLFFKENLHSSQGEEAVNYLISRGIASKEWKKMELGYAPPTSPVYKRWIENYGKETVLELGLMIEKDKKIRKTFFRRLIFPIRNDKSKVVGFSGRALQEEQQPKYLNSSFKKNQLLYGMDRAIPAIQKNKFLVLVEGYFDLITLRQAGFEAVVALCGTTLSDTQMAIIRRFTKQIILYLDGDRAGKEATYKIWKKAIQKNMEISCIPLPEGEDPANFLQKQTKENWNTLLGKKKNVAKLLLENISQCETSSPNSYAQKIHNFVEDIATIPDLITQTTYIRWTAQQLGVDEKNLKELLGRKKKIGNKLLKKTIVQISLSPLIKSEKEILKLLFSHANYSFSSKQTVADYFFAILENFSFQYPLHYRLWKSFQSFWEEGNRNLDNFLEQKSREEKEKIIDYFMEENKYQLSEEKNKDQMRERCFKSIQYLKLYHIQDLLHKNWTVLHKAEKKKEKITSYVNNHSNLIKIRNQITKSLNIVIPPSFRKRITQV